MIYTEAVEQAIREEEEYIDGLKAAYQAAEERGQDFTLKGESV